MIFIRVLRRFCFFSGIYSIDVPGPLQIGFGVYERGWESCWTLSLLLDQLGHRAERDALEP